MKNTLLSVIPGWSFTNAAQGDPPAGREGQTLSEANVALCALQHRLCLPVCDVCRQLLGYGEMEARSETRSLRAF